MTRLFWSGKLSPPMWLLINSNNLMAFFTRGLRDTSGMKERIKNGYEGEYSEHVLHYDERGYSFQDKSARYQLDGITLPGNRVLDVGCGTGALAKVAMEKGAGRVICGDISGYMLDEARKKPAAEAIDYTFCQLDAEALPYRNDSFDAVLTGMSFGLFPDQQLAAAEMVRTTRPGGLVCLGAHGPEHYWEAIDSVVRNINLRYTMGYRFEWWPTDEAYIRKLLEQTGLENIQIKRVIWRNKFASGAAAYDFFSAISSTWWYAKYPPEVREKDSVKTRNYFDRKNIDVITDDIVVGWGYKPSRERYLPS